LLGTLSFPPPSVLEENLEQLSLYILDFYSPDAIMCIQLTVSKQQMKFKALALSQWFGLVSSFFIHYNDADGTNIAAFMPFLLWHIYDYLDHDDFQKVIILDAVHTGHSGFLLTIFGRPYYRSSLCYSVSSVCRLSVCPSSVTFCIVAKRCVLAKKCLKE